MIVILAVIVFIWAHASGLSWWESLAAMGIVVGFRLVFAVAMASSRRR